MLLSAVKRHRGDIVLSWSPTFSTSSRSNSIDQSRRDFLIRCCQAGSLTFFSHALGRWVIPEKLFAVEPAQSPERIQLHPHYRQSMPLDDVLLKVHPGLDEFVSEKYVDEISAILTRWSASLLESPQGTEAFEKVLLKEFSGSSPVPVESFVVRHPPIEVHRNSFSQSLSLDRTTFLAAFATALSRYKTIFTAEFQVTSVDASGMQHSSSTGRLSTDVRYEIIGAGAGFHREQIAGTWQMVWESSSAGEFRLLTWQWQEQRQSRSTVPIYVDVASAAFADSASYATQLLHGSDYWRTLLDVACGIDVYGHNGVSLADIDGDGLDDLYICQPAGLPNRLFRNRGNGTFEDITESSGLGIIENTACALFADFNNDGRQDVIVVRADGPQLYLNEGGGKFRKKKDAFQFAQPPQGTFTGAACADYDRDGWLDVYFCLYTYYQGADQYKYPSPYYDAENGPPNFMMRNNGDGTFSDVTAKSGMDKNNTRYSFCCAWSDFNRDGWPDLYVVNDFGRKNLYRNNGDGTFTDIAAESGVEDVGAGMSVCWFDYDNDGAEDLYVANMWTAAGERVSMQEIFKQHSSADVRALYHKHAMGNSLLHNPFGDRTKNPVKPIFEDRTIPAGVGVGRWAWSSDSWDFDHDGFADLYITNGMVSGPSRYDLNSFFWRQTVSRSPDEARPSHDYEIGWGAINDLIRSDGTWSGYERNVFYANNGDGTFSDVSAVVGLDFIEDGRSFAVGDFDGDGRQEIFLKNRNAPQLRVLKNVFPDLPPAIAFRLRGKKSNPDAIGAVVTVRTARGLQTRSLQAGSGFLSQHSKELFFGLGSSKDPVSASIRWPSGIVQELHDLPLNHRVWVEEGSTPSRIEPFRAISAKAKFLRIEPQPTETLPTIAETWLLPPIASPDFSLPDQAGKKHSLSSLRENVVLLHFGSSDDAGTQADWAAFNRRYASWSAKGLRIVALNFAGPGTKAVAPASAFRLLAGSDDVAAIYGILFRYLFDRRRDIALPSSFLLNARGEIVKVYQGRLDPSHVEHDFQHIPANDAERMAVVLPFKGLIEANDFRRNYLSYGSVYFQRGYIEQAGASFEIAFREDPESAEALYGLGSVYLNQEKLAEARDCFERTLKLRASYPETMANTWNNLGLLAGREGRTADAIASFQHALQLTPDLRPALDNLATAYRVQKRWDEAQRAYEHSLALNPDDPEANYGLGMVFAQNDDNGRALEYLQRALKARPVYPEAMNNLGILFLRSDRVDDAIKIFQQSVRLAPAFDQPYINLARVYSVEEAPDKARDVLEALLKQHPGHPIAVKMLEQLKR